MPAPQPEETHLERLQRLGVPADVIKEVERAQQEGLFDRTPLDEASARVLAQALPLLRRQER